MIGEALRLIRIFHDTTQTDLANSIGVSKSYISEIESGKKTPTLSMLECYSEKFNIPVSSILFFYENLDNNTADQKVKAAVSRKIIAIMNFIAERSGRENVT